VNNGKEVEAKSHQVMKCILCYDNVVNIPSPRTKERKGLITYYKTYGITSFFKTSRCRSFYNSLLQKYGFFAANIVTKMTIQSQYKIEY